ncbi:MAG TPA: rRNA maturation RNase YbeY [Saprospiraceae bacterium]|nr:rRNA maturation RNase YbeY [Saprospiraceae bacterium]HOY12536.1 rRNA maturation RNase YbeY [Saprospiraceae bacterium]HPN68802.1 rRNA maturation RNase YbeY [Saprospiraceae bacterium]
MVDEELVEDDQPSLPIEFIAEDVSFPPFFDEQKSLEWLTAIVSLFGSKIIHINYIFCSDEYLLDINQKYLSHDYYTDIITFPFQQGKRLESDIFISLERVAENATDNDVSYQDELLRVMAHGVLHLLGLKDKEDADIMRMRQEEDLAIQAYYKLVVP